MPTAMPLISKTRSRRPPASPALARSAVAVVALLLALTSALGIAGAQLLQEQEEDSASPATGHA